MEEVRDGGQGGREREREGGREEGSLRREELTSSVMRTGSIPKKGDMGKPGFGVVLVEEGRGVIMMPPVSGRGGGGETC